MTAPLRIYVIRHGDTAWSRSGQHTSRTDLPLTSVGECAANALQPLLDRIEFSNVYSSPSLRARWTCARALPGSPMTTEPDLAEWDYGSYEGMRTLDIQSRRPGWNIWKDGCPGGEQPRTVAARANRFLAKISMAGGCIALFTHGHFGRLLATSWIGARTLTGGHFVIGPASIGILTFDQELPPNRVIALWNQTPNQSHGESVIAGYSEIVDASRPGW